jgi:cob(I)alamin adenosyltransferase
MAPVPGEEPPSEPLALGWGGERARHGLLWVGPMKLYTKTGDGGETGLFDGTRVAKSDPRVEAYGAVDELEAWLGLVRSHRIDADVEAMLSRIQHDLFALGAILADPSHRIAARVRKATLGLDDVTRLEGWIDTLDGALPPLRHFVLAGGTPAAGLLQVARAVCRRAERRIVLLGADAVDPVLLTYINRLSDLLFVMARTANARSSVAEHAW